MHGRSFEFTRRMALAAAMASSAGSSAAASARANSQQASGSEEEAALAAHAHDWDWLVGRWNVRHRRLKERLRGSNEWEEFDGASEMWLTLAGFGTVDDNVLELPTGTYRAVGIRAFDRERRRWAIWWLDARNPTRIDPPVYGAFENGEGVFIGDDTLRGQPIKVRFRWWDIQANTARWEQAFSPDGGQTWEVNWDMRFARAA